MAHSAVVRAAATGPIRAAGDGLSYATTRIWLDRFEANEPGSAIVRADEKLRVVRVEQASQEFKLTDEFLIVATEPIGKLPVIVVLPGMPIWLCLGWRAEETGVSVGSPPRPAD